LFKSSSPANHRLTAVHGRRKEKKGGVKSSSSCGGKNKEKEKGDATLFLVFFARAEKGRKGERRRFCAVCIALLPASRQLFENGRERREKERGSLLEFERLHVGGLQCVSTRRPHAPRGT